MILKAMWINMGIIAMICYLFSSCMGYPNNALQQKKVATVQTPVKSTSPESVELNENYGIRAQLTYRPEDMKKKEAISVKLVLEATESDVKVKINLRTSGVVAVMGEKPVEISSLKVGEKKEVPIKLKTVKDGTGSLYADVTAYSSKGNILGDSSPSLAFFIVGDDIMAGKQGTRQLQVDYWGKLLESGEITQKEYEDKVESIDRGGAVIKTKVKNNP